MALRTALRLQRLHHISVLRNCHLRRFGPIELCAMQPSGCPPLRRCYSSELTDNSKPSAPRPQPLAPLVQRPRWTPPPLCPGCGAPSQQTDPSHPGHYGQEPREGAKTKLSPQKSLKADKLWEDALRRAEGDPNLLQQLNPGNPEEEQIADRLDGLAPLKSGGRPNLLDLPPICDRCHELKFHHDAPSLPSYPTLKTLSSLLLSSRHKHNHIYHLIDAADFPLSLHPELLKYLHKTLPKSLTRNLTISYIITRCDLLMPKEKQISSYMTYFKSTLKKLIPEDQKLESSRTKLHAISGRTGWEIGALKKEISQRQGGVWFLGAVNVGKSTLLKDVWPMDGVLRPTPYEDAAEFDILPADEFQARAPNVGDVENDVEHSAELLGKAQQQPPAQATEKLASQAVETPQSRAPPSHVPPTISDVPGTTAAPIRVSYQSAGRDGKFRGEVVDLPGLERWVGFKETGLMKYVRKNRLRALAMRERVNPSQYVIKTGQSMLLGGLMMITPKTSDVVVLANPFTSLPIHVSSTAKCLGFLSSPDPEHALDPYPECFFQDPETLGLPSSTETGNEEQVDPTLPPVFASAGIFTLSDDVTTKRNPMLEDRSPKSIAELPYKVLATDILFEGIGWVELTTQVRSQRNAKCESVEVEIFTPEGKGVGQRETMSVYMAREEGARMSGLRKKSSRPAMSMKGKRKQRKLSNKTN